LEEFLFVRAGKSTITFPEKNLATPIAQNSGDYKNKQHFQQHILLCLSLAEQKIHQDTQRIDVH